MKSATYPPLLGPSDACHRAVAVAAFFWSFVVFMPVGLNYLGLVSLLTSMAITGGWRERLRRLRASPVWRPLVALAIWIAVVLLFRPHYDETGLSLWHDVRIVLTFAAPMMLSVDEAVWALRGFVVAVVVAVLAAVLAHTIGFPDLQVLHNVITMKGNKSINNALLFALVGAGAAVYGLATLRGSRAAILRAIVALAVVMAMGALVTWALPSRTSLLGLTVAVLGICVHQWRDSLRVTGVAVVVTVLIAGSLMWNTPSVKDKFELGAQELVAANTGTVSEGSWVVRYFMYRETTKMMLDQPFAGYGLGSWTPEWHLRGPTELRDYSMPHDDFLWFGAETGVPGLLALLAIMAAGLWAGWKDRNVTGRMAWAAMLVLLVATLVNSALRDAAIGLSLPWISLLWLRLADTTSSSWTSVWPPSWQPRWLGGHQPRPPATSP